MAFKTSGSDDILRVDKGTVTSAQWSRAARGYMLKLLTATNVYKFCGFNESVSLVYFKTMSTLFCYIVGPHQIVRICYEVFWDTTGGSGVVCTRNELG